MLPAVIVWIVLMRVFAFSDCNITSYFGVFDVSLRATAGELADGEEVEGDHQAENVLRRRRP